MNGILQKAGLQFLNGFVTQVLGVPVEVAIALQQLTLYGLKDID